LPSEHDLTYNLLENTFSKGNALFPTIYTNSRDSFVEIMQ